MDLFTKKLHNVLNIKLAEELYPICREILKDTKDDDRYLFGKTTFWQQELMKNHIHKFTNFFKFIDTEARKFLDDLDLDIEDKQIYVKDFWISEMYRGGCHSTHVHSPENDISGNFYVHSEPNSSNIVFNRDITTGDYMKNLKRKSYTRYNSAEWSFPPEPGRLLMWESNLLHSVEQNLSDSRISLTYNLKVE